jgi:hypothetical protein
MDAAAARFTIQERRAVAAVMQKYACQTSRVMEMLFDLNLGVVGITDCMCWPRHGRRRAATTADATAGTWFCAAGVHGRRLDAAPIVHQGAGGSVDANEGIARGKWVSGGVDTNRFLFPA